MTNDEFFDDSLLFDTDEEQEKQEMSFLDKEVKNLDGIYRPSLDVKGVDPRDGYKATLRFLRNLTRDHKIGPAAVEKYVHYVDLQNHPELSGYYDCQKSKGEDCPLCKLFWQLRNSTNQADVEKSNLINRQGKWYSYIEVLEDENQPELVGKVMVYPYTYQVKEKIDDEMNGTITGEKCNVFRLENGKDFRLIIKEKTRVKKGNNVRILPTYESSVFRGVSPVKIWSEKKGKFVEAKLDENGKISDVNYQKAIKEMIMGRGENVNVEDYEPKLWTDEEYNKINKVISILTGEEIEDAEASIKTTRNKTSAIKEELLDDIIGDDDDDDTITDFDSDDDFGIDDNDDIINDNDDDDDDLPF